MKNIIIFLLLIISSANVEAKIYKILFLGNSYTYVNDLPNTFKAICTSEGDSVEVTSYSPGGYTFQSMSNDANALAQIQMGSWDFVVLQGQSQEPSFPPSQVATNTYPYAKKLDSLVKAYNTCAEVVYYMTWGRKYGDASNCASYPVICTYNGMQQRLRESYIDMAQNNASSVSPVGIVWKKVRETDSTIELYNADLSHPSMKGTYLAACTFYASLFHKGFTTNTYTSPGINTNEASLIQNATTKIVLDSIETWQQYGNIPNANFTYTFANNIFTFTNFSKRHTASNWSFGDAQTSTSNANTVANTYTNSGNYPVLLSVENTCGKIDTAFLNITVSSNTALKDFLKSNISIQTTPATIIFNDVNPATDVEIFSIEGKLLGTYKTINNSFVCEKFNHQIIVFRILKNGMVLYSSQLKVN
jgi:hypothetical protein